MNDESGSTQGGVTCYFRARSRYLMLDFDAGKVTGGYTHSLLGLLENSPITWHRPLCSIGIVNSPDRANSVDTITLRDGVRRLPGRLSTVKA